VQRARLEQDEGELADLRQADGGENRGTARQPSASTATARDQRLERDHERASPKASNGCGPITEMSTSMPMATKKTLAKTRAAE
jgi:hypothetical protein